ncbi:MAG: N-methylhydantoinase [Gaiellales bacterium]|nr:N-methylhydantoinase [Gaiellales bacterium]
MTLAGIDVGGTFTDAVLVGDDGRLTVAKVATRPEDIAGGLVDALETVLARASAAPGAVSYLAHGTTIATNAIVQRRLARTALITNEGFRDVLEIGTQMRPRVYDLWTPQPRPVVERQDAFGVPGRLAAGGAELQPLDEAALQEVAAALARRGIEAIAVVFLHAFANDAHERQAADVLGRALPGVPISLSSRVAPEFREYLRASTTALNASLLPLVGGYVRALAERVAAAGVQVPLHLMQSSGGVATADAAAELPVALAASGPAAGVIGSARLGSMVGEHDLLTFDMGGTTADVALVVGGRPQLRFASEQEGLPVNLPQIDLLSIGAGGGSIARVDAFGALSVGPLSAGAVPGPAAYGLGGEDATVTDAHVVLGTLGVERALGSGQTRLDEALARAAVERGVATPLGLSTEAAAAAVVRVANATMAQALRLVSVARGHDPRALALVALGGAGPMHACDIADELGAPRVLVPRFPGITAALGLLVSDIQHDARVSYLRATAGIDAGDLAERIGALEAEARDVVARSAHGGTPEVTADVDMRYRGQAYNLTVPLALPVTAASLAAAERAFAEAHRAAYNYTPEVEDTDVVTLRVRVAAPAPAIDWSLRAEAAGAAGSRPVWRDGAWRDHAVIERAGLAEGATVDGPCLLEQEDATTLIPEGWSGAVAAAGTIVLSRR